MWLSMLVHAAMQACTATQAGLPSYAPQLALGPVASQVLLPPLAWPLTEAMLMAAQMTHGQTAGMSGRSGGRKNRQPCRPGSRKGPHGCQC